MSSGLVKSSKVKIPDVFAQNDKEESLKTSSEGKKSIAQIVKENSNHRRNNSSLAFIKEEESRLKSSGEDCDNTSFLADLLDKDALSMNEHITDNPTISPRPFRSPRPLSSEKSSPSPSPRPLFTEKSSPNLLLRQPTQSDIHKYIDSVVNAKLKDFEKILSVSNNVIKDELKEKISKENSLLKNELEEKMIKENTLLKDELHQKIDNDNVLLRSTVEKDKIDLKTIIEEVISKERKSIEQKLKQEKSLLKNEFEQRLNEENTLLKDELHQKIDNENNCFKNELEQMMSKENSLLRSTFEQKINEQDSKFQTKVENIDDDKVSTIQNQQMLEQRLADNQKIIEEQQRIIQQILDDSTIQRQLFENYMSTQQHKLEEVVADNHKQMKQNEQLRKELDAINNSTQKQLEENKSLKEELANVISTNQKLIKESTEKHNKLKKTLKETQQELSLLKSSKATIPEPQVEVVKDVNETSSFKNDVEDLKLKIDANDSTLKEMKSKIDEIASLENVRYKSNIPVDIEIISAVIPKNIKTLQPNYYKGCSNLKKIVFESTYITTIPTGFCENCIELEEVVLSSSITEINTGAFTGCSKLKIINFENIKTIHTKAFTGCGFETVNLSNVTTIEPFAFKDNSKLKNPIIGTSIKTIPKGLFENCSSLDKINIPITIDFISQRAFIGCSLKEVNVRKAMVQRGAFDQGIKIYKHK